MFGQIKSFYEDDTFIVCMTYKDSIKGNIIHFKSLGSAFQIRDNIVVTASHVLKSSIEESERNNASYWLISRDLKKRINITDCEFVSFPEVDVTLIKLLRSYDFHTTLDLSMPEIGDIVFNYGVNGETPKEFFFEGPELDFVPVDISNCLSDSVGIVLNFGLMDMKSDDVNLNDAKTLFLSFRGEKGQSGGPVYGENGVVGMMCYVLDLESNKFETAAISIQEIYSRMLRIVE